MALSAKKASLNVLRFMKNRANYSEEKIKNLYDRLKSSGIVTVDNEKENVTISIKDLERAKKSLSKKTKITQKPNLPPENTAEEKGSEIIDNIQPESNQEKILEKLADIVKNFTRDIESQIEILKKEEEKLRGEAKKLDPIKNAQAIAEIEKVFTGLREVFIACNRARGEVTFLGQDAKNHPEKTADSIAKAQYLVTETEKKIEESKTLLQKAFESLLKNESLPVSEPEDADKSTIRKINEKRNNTSFATAEDAKFEPVNPNEKENTTQPSAEELREFQDFFDQLKLTTKTNLDKINQSIESENAKNSPSSTVKYLKQAKNALGNLWEEMNTQIKSINPLSPPANLRETKKILSDLAAETGDYISGIGRKIASETRSVRNAEKIRGFLNRHDGNFKSLSKKITEKLNLIYKIIKPNLLRTSLIVPFLIAFPTQETGQENFRGMNFKTTTVDSIQKDNQPTLDSLFAETNPDTINTAQTETARKFGYRVNPFLSPEDARLRDSLAEENMADNRFDMLTFNSKIAKAEYDKIKNISTSEFMEKYLKNKISDSTASEQELEHRQNFALQISRIKNFNFDSKEPLEDELIKMYYKKTK